jgi:hypothetical protein
MQFNLYALLFAGLAATGLALPQTELGTSGCYIREATEKTCAPGYPKQCTGSSGTTIFPYCCKTSSTVC